MEVVFGGGLWPLGQKVGFAELELDEATETNRAWTRGWKPPLGIEADTPSAYDPATLIQERFVRVSWRAGLDEARAEALRAD